MFSARILAEVARHPHPLKMLAGHPCRQHLMLKMLAARRNILASLDHIAMRQSYTYPLASASIR